LEEIDEKTLKKEDKAEPSRLPPMVSPEPSPYGEFSDMKEYMPIMSMFRSLLKGSEVSIPEAIIISVWLQSMMSNNRMGNRELRELIEEIRSLRKELIGGGTPTKASPEIEALKEEIKTIKDMFEKLIERERERQITERVKGMIAPLEKDIGALSETVKKLLEGSTKAERERLEEVQKALTSLSDALDDIRKRIESGEGSELARLKKAAEELKMLRDTIAEVSDAFKSESAEAPPPLTTENGKPNVASVIERFLRLAEKALDKLGRSQGQIPVQPPQYRQFAGKPEIIKRPTITFEEEKKEEVKPPAPESGRTPKLTTGGATKQPTRAGESGSGGARSEGATGSAKEEPKTAGKGKTRTTRRRTKKPDKELPEGEPTATKLPEKPKPSAEPAEGSGKEGGQKGTASANKA